MEGADSPPGGGVRVGAGVRAGGDLGEGGAHGREEVERGGVGEAVDEGWVAGGEGADAGEEELGALLAEHPAGDARRGARARPLPEGDPRTMTEGAAEEGAGLGEVGGELLAEALGEDALALEPPALLLQGAGLELLLPLQPQPFLLLSGARCECVRFQKASACRRKCNNSDASFNGSDSRVHR